MELIILGLMHVMARVNQCNITVYIYMIFLITCIYICLSFFSFLVSFRPCCEAGQQVSQGLLGHCGAYLCSQLDKKGRDLQTMFISIHDPHMIYIYIYILLLFSVAIAGGEQGI